VGDQQSGSDEGAGRPEAENDRFSKLFRIKR
jgi:hypothetical protein